MEKKLSYLGVFVAALLFLVTLGTSVAFFVERQKAKEQVAQLNEHLMEAKLELGKAKSEFGSAEKYIKELEESLQAQLEKNNEHVIAYGKLLAKYKVKGGSNGSIVVTTGDYPSRFFKKGVLYKGISETEVKEITYFAGTYQDFRIQIDHILGSNPGNEELLSKFSYELDMKIVAQLIRTTTKSGAVNEYVVIHEVDDNGKKVGKFEVQEFSVVVEDQRQAGFKFAPHLAIGIGGIASGVTKLDAFSLSPNATVELSLLGYGVTENDLSWRFPSIGVDIMNGGVGLSLSPVKYNIGQHIPLLSNMWVGPKIGVGIPAPYTSGYIGMDISVVM